jgi:Tfp pilus assembly protein PilN
MQTGTKSTFWVRAVGVYFAEGRLTITATAWPPFGSRGVAPAAVPIEGTSPGKALAAWLESHLTPRQRRHVPVCIGFFTSRAIETAPEQAPTSEALLSMVGASWIDGADAVADGIRLKLGGTPAYSIAACRRELAEDFLQGLKDCGATKSRIVPAPWAVQTLGRCKGRPRSWKVFIQVVLTNSGGLAVLVVHGHPLLWRRFVSAGQDFAELISAVRHLQVYARQNLAIRDIAGIAVLGPMTAAEAENLTAEIGLTVVARDPRQFNEGEFSHLMAVCATRDGHESLDLLRSLRPPATLREMFPQKLVIIMAAAIGAMGLFLQSTLWSLEGDYRSVKRQNASYKWAAKMRTADIETEKKALQAEVSAVENFLTTRIIWSNYLRDLPTRLPRNACLTDIIGEFEIEDASKKKRQRKASRDLTLRGMAQFANRGSAPKEIDAFLESLREVSLLKKDFPLVNLAEIKWRKEGAQDIALFTVLAVPPEKAKPSASKKESKQ